MVHQHASADEVEIQEGGYGSGMGCGSIVSSAYTLFRAGQEPVTSASFRAPLPVDIALEKDGVTMAVAAAGVVPGLSVGTSDLAVIQPTLDTRTSGVDLGGCNTPAAPPDLPTLPGQAVAVGFAGRSTVVQTREPAMLVVGKYAVSLPGETPPGHRTSPVPHVDLSRARVRVLSPRRARRWSCLAVRGDGRAANTVHCGRDRGHRTVPLGRDMKDFAMLAHEVMGSRMLGPSLTDEQTSVLSRFVNHIPALKPIASSDPAAVERGHALFTNQNVGCASCHAGTKLTNNQSLNVGTGGAFQVPSLVAVGWRAPYLHNGCASTLRDRFGSCGGEMHGRISELAETDLGDLVAYLDSSVRRDLRSHPLRAVISKPPEPPHATRANKRRLIFGARRIVRIVIQFTSYSSLTMRKHAIVRTRSPFDVSLRVHGVRLAARPTALRGGPIVGARCRCTAPRVCCRCRRAACPFIGGKVGAPARVSRDWHPYDMELPGSRPGRRRFEDGADGFRHSDESGIQLCRRGPGHRNGGLAARHRARRGDRARYERNKNASHPTISWM